MEVVVTTSTKTHTTKCDARIDGTKTISFGDSNYSDFTKHKDTDRKEAYINSNSKEDWSKSNIASSARMSRYIVCEKQHLKVLLIALIKHINMLNVC